MDDAGGVIFGVIVLVFISFIVGFMSYMSGRDGMRDQAVAAGVGCYTAPQNGAPSVFQWNCKAPAPL